MIKAQILADSRNAISSDRITTLKVTFPRIVLAEFNTHRMLSKNSASSRAIPFKKMLEMVENNPFVPLLWQKDHKGMQGTEYLDFKKPSAIMEWMRGRDAAVRFATDLNQDHNVTKQLANRLLEPFMWHTVIATGTDAGWDQFFKLRCPQYKFNGELFRSRKDVLNSISDLPVTQKALEDQSLEDWFKMNQSAAEVHIQLIAEAIWDAMQESEPITLQPGEWHIPMGDKIDDSDLNKLLPEIQPQSMGWYVRELDKLRVKIATARCARVSYETLGDNPKIDYEADIKLHDSLLQMEHMSPFEHCAKAMDKQEMTEYVKGRLIYDDPEVPDLELRLEHEVMGWCRNFRGFVQYRELVEKNCRTKMQKV